MKLLTQTIYPRHQQDSFRPNRKSSLLFLIYLFISEHESIQAYLTLNNKEDTLTQSQMLKTTDANLFIKAQTPEIRGLEKMGVFKYSPIHTLPPRARLLSSIWSYRRKRRPNGALLKHKARLCVDGSQQ
jgi:hypothetical protein